MSIAMFKYLILVIWFNYIDSHKIEDIDGFFANSFKIGDPDHLFVPSLIHVAISCDAPPPESFIEKTKEVFNRDFGDSPDTMAMAQIMLKPFENITNVPSCKLARKGLDKAKLLAEKIDSRINETKVIRDQFISTLTEAAQPNTKATGALLICYGKQWAKKTLEVYPESDGQREFVKEYINLMIFPILQFWEKKIQKIPDSCEFPPAYPVPSKYKSAQIPALIASYNMFKKGQK